MIAIKVTFTNGTTKVLRAIEEEKYNSLKHASYSIRKDAKESIKKKRGASPEGEPPHAHKEFFRRALWAAIERNRWESLIGFRYSKIETVGAIHEHGLKEEGRDYPVRPTMLPALERNLGRFHEDWRASLT